MKHKISFFAHDDATWILNSFCSGTWYTAVNDQQNKKAKNLLFQTVHGNSKINKCPYQKHAATKKYYPCNANNR
jgi:hypothetical protein